MPKSKHSQGASDDVRWVHTWNVAEDTGETKAKARFVVKGSTDPDLTEIRSESPTLKRLSRQLILQDSCFAGFRLRKGDVKTAFVSGDRAESRRDAYAAPSRKLREKISEVLKLENCCVRSSRRTRQWWKRVVRDLTATGWVHHQLDQCTELVGLIGVYVDDFLVAGCDDNPIFSAALSKLNGTFQWRTWNEDN